MGCDGGTIPRRDELVRIKKKPEQKDKEAELAFKWRHCTIKQLPLQEPVVGCALGHLYSKESVLEGLLDRSTLPESAVHIKSLKDIKNLNLTPNPAYVRNKAEKGDCYADCGKSPYICPVIGLEMNGKYRFCFLWKCGCVISERALKEVKSNVCHKCQQPFEETDIVILNPEDEDVKLMKERIEIRKTMRKGNKKKKLEEIESGSGSTMEVTNKKKMKKDDKAAGSSKLVPSNKGEAKDPAYNKTKEDYKIAQDPKASEVYKSIFTTHKSAVEKDKAHWITYNPFYN
ncbi:replication termination factor 2 [Prorops nasuta]|uniref:replication termination factor 2 n=1 Tax=Prorops nasuta TaxID=863751 RepID=UPI0034CDB848